MSALVSQEARRVTQQRMRLLELHPFWGYLLMQLELVPDETLPAIAATDCVRFIRYNPALTQALTPEQLGFVLAHEVGHTVYASFERRRGRVPGLWNAATDYAINRIVASIPHPGTGAPLYQPVPGILLESRFDGMVAEAIYERLAKEEQSVSQLVGDAEGEGEPSPRAGRGEGRGRGVAREVTVAGRPALDHGGGLDIHLPDELSDEVREALAERVRAALEHARSTGRSGHVPGEWARAFGAGQQRMPWARLFRRFVSTALTRDEYDPRRPHRRWASQGFVVPSLAGERVGSVVVALDTSGSMSRALLAELCAELRALAREVDELHLVVADSEVRETVTLDGLEVWLRAGRAQGGGGTDHRPVFEWVRRRGLRPDVFIGLTDLYTVLPERAPPYPVLWVVPEHHGSAPWGRVLEARG